MNDLGPSIFEIHNKIYERIDFTVVNKKNMMIHASIWKLKYSKSYDQITCYSTQMLIYLHCNCGSRVEAMQFVNQSLELGYSFLAYDSRGCGHS
jgi:hypothetical protein